MLVSNITNQSTIPMENNNHPEQVKKPSERINELFNQEPYWSNLPGAIIQYLDENFMKVESNSEIHE